MDRDTLLGEAGDDRPVLIAGPTASGKSALAADIATKRGGVIVNADALQVFADWRVLTARPSPEEEAALPHALYGHVPGDRLYSAGDWLRDVTPHVHAERHRPIIVGGTGLYFTTLTRGLAQIPAVPDRIRQEAEARLRAEGHHALVADLDRATAVRIDTHNPRRVQRAWEVLTATGRGLALWQDETGPPLLPLDKALPVVIDADRDWLAERIERRFDAMLEGGALDEARAHLDTWDRAAPSSKAIGAADLIAHLRGDITLAEARESAIVQTRQYAKRQRSWFRSRMKDWIPLTLSTK